MNLGEDPAPTPMKQLPSERDPSKAALPDFQRDFVWEPSAIQEQIVSIANPLPRAPFGFAIPINSLPTGGSRAHQSSTATSQPISPWVGSSAPPPYLKRSFEWTIASQMKGALNGSGEG